MSFSRIFRRSGEFILRISTKTARIPNVAGVSLVHDVLVVNCWLPAIVAVSRVIGVPAVAFSHAVAFLPAVAGVAVTGVPAVAGILFVAESLVLTGCTLPKSTALEPSSVNPLRRPCPL